MSFTFYDEEEERRNENEESLNNYSHIFPKYKEKPPSLSEALEQMFQSVEKDKEIIEKCIKDIINKCEIKINETIKEIKKEYPKISEEDAKIIASYTCECKIEKEYSPYRILNQNLV